MSIRNSEKVRAQACSTLVFNFVDVVRSGTFGNDDEVAMEERRTSARFDEEA